ncbi:MAG: dipeptide ABC transporter ATP-binding protein [Deltaproteobacteria bacterium]|nr:dipeptide ABC transporter ATP-binding protein [Deltaproteobacteria bacterium]
MSLRVEHLGVVYRDGDHGVLALDDVSLALEPGRCLALVGESGSGKTTLGKACMGLLPRNAEIGGCILLEGRPLDLEDEAAMNRVRWSAVSMVFQSGAANLNPVHRVLDQVAEPLIQNQGAKRAGARERAAEALEKVGLERGLHGRYPHQLSGGQAQRVLLAMAGILDPEVVLLDEPTSALDAASKTFVARAIREMKAAGKALLLISHDLEFALYQADAVAVIYLGQIMETLPASELLSNPRHPYTLALGRSYPAMDTVRDLGGIRGDAFYRIVHRHGRDNGGVAPHTHIQIPGSSHRDGHPPPTGCLFQNRCTQAISACSHGEIALEEADGHRVRCLRGGIVRLLRMEGVSKQYDAVRALDGVDLEVKAGEVLSLVGETGSGKTTLAMTAAGVLRPDAGTRVFDGEDMDGWIRRDYRSLARRIGVIYQNPAEAVSHRFTVLDAVAEPLRIHGLAGGREDLEERVKRRLQDVHLSTDPGFLERYPHELNMGAIQRVCMARALVLDPGLLVADEPTSSLDPSVQAKIMKLLLHLQAEMGLSLLFVTHDIGLARKISDRIAVMLAGRIVEIGPASMILHAPGHPYTRLLLESAAGRLPEIPPRMEAAEDPGSGCAFAPRCARRTGACLSLAPLLAENGPRQVACHAPLPEG